MILTDRQEKLFEFVKECHKGQFRKYTGEPYHVHPYAVAELVSSYVQSEFTIEIALCHDLFEDTDCDRSMLLSVLTEKLGYELQDSRYICHHVEELTDVYTSEAYPDFNRDIRKGLEFIRLRDISSISQSVKYADLIDNTESIVDRDEKFAKVYLKEKEVLLQRMRDGDMYLFADCVGALRDAFKYLEYKEL